MMYFLMVHYLHPLAAVLHLYRLREHTMESDFNAGMRENGSDAEGLGGLVYLTSVLYYLFLPRLISLP